MSDDYKSYGSTTSGGQGETNPDIWDRARRLAAARAVENYTLDRHRETIDTVLANTSTSYTHTGLFGSDWGSDSGSSFGTDSAYASGSSSRSGSGSSSGSGPGSALGSTTALDSTSAHDSTPAYSSSSAYGSSSAYDSGSGSSSGSGKAPEYEGLYGTTYTGPTTEIYSSPSYRVTRTDFSLPDDTTDEQAARQRFWDGGLGRSTTYRSSSPRPPRPPPVQVASFEAGPPVDPGIERRGYEVKETDYYQAYDKFDYKVPRSRSPSPLTRRRVHWADGYGSGSGSGSKY
ncbi:hypothetical protein GGS26DRAFT_165565 [Hypomontagnella submonticulosa]|nr:hypothetical protein GGS26DRAFT_165565 [Hypomontagnella submonticulosa]